MLEKFHDVFLANDDMLSFEEEFGKVTFLANVMDTLGVDLNNPETIIHVRLLSWHSKFEKRKALEKDIIYRINACSMASNKMVRLVLVKR